MTDTEPPSTADDALRELLSPLWDDRAPQARRGRWLWGAGGFLVLGAVIIGALVASLGGDTTTTTTDQSALSTFATEAPPPGFLGQPSTRSLGIMFSVGGGRVVMVGGIRGELANTVFTPLDETWVYVVEDNEWYQIAASAGPGPRVWPAAAFDEQSGLVVLFGGAGKADWMTCIMPYVDAWCGGPALGDTWLLSIETWEWTASRATGGPSERFGAAVAYDSGSESVVLFGGARPTGDRLLPEVFDDTWVYDADTDEWTQMHPDTRPPARAFASMAYDPEAGLVLLWGGVPSRRGSLLPSSVWAYDLSLDSWTEIATSGEAPSGAAGAAWSYIETTGRLVLLGGTAVSEDSDERAASGEMYEFDPGTGAWTRLDPVPTSVTGPSAAYEPRAARLVAVGRGNTALYNPADHSWQLAERP